MNEETENESVVFHLLLNLVKNFLHPYVLKRERRLIMIGGKGTGGEERNGRSIKNNLRERNGKTWEVKKKFDRRFVLRSPLDL